MGIGPADLGEEPMETKMTTISRYSVYREYVSGRDGDKGFDDLRAAEIEFHASENDNHVVRVELIDNTGDEPVVVASRSLAS